MRPLWGREHEGEVAVGLGDRLRRLDKRALRYDRHLATGERHFFLACLIAVVTIMAVAPGRAKALVLVPVLGFAVLLIRVWVEGARARRPPGGQA